jgi:four helix bundle protein
MKDKIKKFEDLRIWVEAHRLVLEIYKLTKSFPPEERFILVSQLLRAATSIPANIVEGFCRNTTKELIQFLFTSRGSTGEVIYFLLLAKDLKYISEESYLNLRNDYESLAKSINALINSLKKK